MKSVKRKLLSLLLAMAMILTLAPTALATATATLGITGATDDPVDGAYPLGTTVTLTVEPSGFTEEDGELSYVWSGASGDGETATVTSNTARTIEVSCTVIATKDGEENQRASSNTVPVLFADPEPAVVPVESVSITEGATATAAAGGTLQLHATVSPDNATTQGVTWSSSNPDKATVSENGGLVTVNVNATGTVDITATSKGTNASGNTVSATCRVTITEATVDHIDFSGNTATMNAGSTITVTATPKTAGGQTLDKTVRWTPVSPATPTAGITITPGTDANANKVTIATTTAVTADTDVTLSASVDGVSNSFTVTVKPQQVANITLTLTPATVKAGEKSMATATIPSTLVYGQDYDTIVWSSSTAAATVTGLTGSNRYMANIDANSAGTPTIKVQLKKGTTVVGEGSAVLTITGTAFTIVTSAVSGYQNDYNATTRTFNSLSARAEAYFTGGPSDTSNYTILWESSNKDVIGVQNQSNLVATLVSVGRGSADLTVTLTNRTTKKVEYTDTKTIYVSYSYDLNPTVTVYRQEDYNLADTDAKNGSSIVRQLTDRATGAYYYSYVTFSDVTATGGSLTAKTTIPYYIGSIPTGISSRNAGLLSDVDFIPSSSSTVTRAEFRFTLTTTYNNGGTYSSYTGLMTFNITGEASSEGDITYTSELGKDVYFDLKDFENFYYAKTRGTLSYVSFTLPSGGTLYADGGRLNSNNACYVSPNRTQTDLAGVYFTPTGTTATRPSTVRITFTAYGTSSNTGSTGTLVINYLSGTAKDITYTPSGTAGINLKVSDFTDAYRQAVGTTAPSGLTIQFQDVPTYGSLTYKDSSRNNSSTVTLRSNNVKGYKFTTRTSGSNQLGDVTYTPSGNHSDTISYIAYNGTTPQFSGKVVFNPSVVTNNMSVTFTGGQTITLNQNNFITANAVVMASCATIRFTSAPVSGTMTFNGAAVTPGVTIITPSMLSNVVYRANNGFNGTDKVIFACADASGNTLATGQINLIVSGNNTGISNISQFTDVPANSWYAGDLSTLVSRGIMQGKGDGKFDPKGELKYGEALKIFLLAAGYPAQQENTGGHWAANYKTVAQNNGWISSDIDLDARISRNAMAELAAKALGVSASSMGSPWNDGTANAYAIALYYTSPQILKGNADGTFKGNTTLQRQEICAIAARVISYKEAQQSASRPGWLG